MTLARLKLWLTIACAAGGILGLTGCKSADPNPARKWPVAGETGGSTSTNGALILMASSMLRVGDLITVSFSDVPPPGLVEIKARIPENGVLTLHYNVQVKAVEKTIPQLEQDIRAAYVPRLYRNLTAIVRAEERAFYVGGEVRQPGRFPLLGEMTVLRAIETAGSFTDFAKRTKIELRRENGQAHNINWEKARKNPALDLPVLPNDHIYIPRRVL